MGLFKLNESQKNSYDVLRKSLNLIVDDVDEYDPNDIAYVYSGFAYDI